MKRKRNIGQYLLLAAMTLNLLACAQQPPLPSANFYGALPAVAAQYRTTQTGMGGNPPRGDQRVEWRFWRDTDSLLSENLDNHTGEQWQRDGNTVFHRKLFHADQHAIEFQMDDLRILNVMPNWREKALLIDAALLTTLPLADTGWRDGYPFHHYRGKLKGVRWDILIRLDLLLPVRIVREQTGFKEITELQSAHALTAAPWQPTSADRYQIIDFADLGDRESDPFVRKVEALMGNPHHHH